MEALVQRQPVPGLHPVPELERCERDERYAAADKQQADEKMAQREKLVEQFHRCVLRTLFHSATTYLPRPTRWSSPCLYIPAHVSVRDFSAPSSTRSSTAVRPSGYSRSTARMRWRAAPRVGKGSRTGATTREGGAGACGAGARRGASWARGPGNAGTGALRGMSSNRWFCCCICDSICNRSVSRSRAASSSRCNTSIKRSRVRVSVG